MKITKVYSQEVPALRFIGKCYGDSDRVNGSFGAKWQEAFADGLFDAIEQAAGGKNAQESLFQDAGAYIGLMRAKEGEPFQYWIGLFTAADTPVPEGLSAVDFPPSRFGISWIYGNEAAGDIYCHEQEAATALTNAGMKLKSASDGACWCFERYQCPRYTTPDKTGNVTLDLGFFIE